MKTKIIILSVICSMFSASAFAALNGGSSTVPAGTIPNKNFSDSAIGAGISAGIRFNLAEDVFTEAEEIGNKSKEVENRKRDHIFTEMEVFGNQFFSGEIKQNFGGRLNLGYEFKGVRIYGSGGYVSSTIDYQETGNTKQSVSEGAPFFGIGLGYDLTKNVSVRLNSMFYNFDFKPKNSGYQSAEVDVTAVTLGLAIHY
jgi:hypothetical protein